MDLLKFLRRNKVADFEALLKKAVTDPAYRAEFYRRLLTEEIRVITKQNRGNGGLVKLQEDTTVQIFTFENGSIPVFTSTERIFDKGVIKHQVFFLACAGEDLFNFTKGTTLILNPYSDYGKELLPEEITKILNGSILESNKKELKIKKSTNVLIGQPAKYPTEIVKSLSNFFSNRKDVLKAYVAWIHDPSSDDPPHYIFAIDTSGDWRNISDEAGFIANQILDKNEFVDFIQITNRGGINDYFLNDAQPFYIKQ